MMDLEQLLRTTVEVITPIKHEKVRITPDFRIAVQALNFEGGGHPHIIVHPHGHGGETLDLIVIGNQLLALDRFRTMQRLLGHADQA